jgi:hypothetical protein
MIGAMTRAAAVAMLLVFAVPARADQLPVPPAISVGVDARVELFSVIFHLVGDPEYTPVAGPYALAVEQHFAGFRNHPAVVLSRELRSKLGISYEAPLQLAIYLDASLKPIRPLADAPGMDRWKGVDFDAYLGAVRAFAADTKFDAFVAEQKRYHVLVEQRFRDFLGGLRIVPFYDEVFGPRAGASRRLVPGLLTGKMNYGISAVHADGTEDLVQVVCLEKVDPGALPQPGDMTLDLMVHESAHPYVNPLVDASLGDLQAAAQPLFDRVAQRLRASHYTTVDIMLREAVVRAVVVMWLRKYEDPAHVARSLAEQVNLGFPCTAELADAFTSAKRLDRESLTKATLAGLAACSAAH